MFHDDGRVSVTENAHERNFDWKERLEHCVHFGQVHHTVAILGSSYDERYVFTPGKNQTVKDDQEHDVKVGR